MRRIAQSLAVTGALIGIGVTALPAAASPLGAGRTAGRTHAAQPSPTPAQLRALDRAKRLRAIRNRRGVITGLVRGPGGAPDAGVCVTASGVLTTRRTFTRPDGRFVLAGLPVGAYRVEYRGCSPIARFTAQWYGGLTRASAAKVMVASSSPVELAPVTLGMISPRFTRPSSVAARFGHLNAAERQGRLISKLASGRTFQAPAGARNAGFISGRVTSRSGHPVARVCVAIAPVSSRFFVAVERTGSTGRYRVRVRPGRYYVDFLPLCAAKVNFAPQLWRAAGSIAGASPVRVTAHKTVTGIDASLGAGAVMTGRLRAHAKSHPSLGGLCVIATGTGGQRLFEGFAFTRRDGTFRLPSLATGKYQVLVDPFCGRSRSPWLPLRLRRLVAVTDGKTTSGVTGVLTLGGTVTGTVKSSAGQKLAGICVYANSLTGFSFYQTNTRADGTYRLQGLVAGSYQVAFSTGCGNSGPYGTIQLPDAVRVRQGGTTPHVNAVLPFDGSLTGVVKNSDAKPLSGICVVAQTSDGLNFAVAKTAADGTYVIKRASPGNYQLEFIPGGIFSDCGNKGNYLPVSAAATVTSQATTTADAVLPTGGVLSGVASGSHGRPVAGVCVFSDGEFGGFARTASDGSYRLRQLFSGSYFVGFEGGCGNTESLAPVAYRNDPTFFGPTPITVTAGQVTTGINARMRPGGTVTGRITDQSGRLVNRVCVVLIGVTGAGGGGNFADFQIAREGRYTSTNLPPGQYEVFFFGQASRHGNCRPSPYADQEFSRQGSGAPPDLVFVSGGKVTSGVNAALVPAGKITGAVTDRATGKPVSGICVTATNPRSGVGTVWFTGRHGTYALTGLPAGRYIVEFSSCGGFFFFGESGPNYANQWYKGRSTAASADPVVVRARQASANIDAAMTKGGQISGQVVYRPSQRPVSFVCVFAYTPDFSTLSASLTDRRGHYTVNGLSTGNYIVEFDPCSFESALAGQIKSSRVHVVAGHSVQGIDEQLGLGGSVSGVTSVRLAGGSRPAPGTCVEVLPLSRTASAFLAISLEGGQYQATNLAPGRYQILAGDPGCSSDEPSLAARTSGPVRVSAGQTTAGNVTLPTAGAISGAVRGTAGKPVAGICAEAVPLAGGLGVPAGVTAAGGSYLIGDLQPGRYVVRFKSGCGATGYATRWYKNAPSRAGATVVVVRAAHVTTGINVALHR
jgi:carboxypeptidase family protein